MKKITKLIKKTSLNKALIIWHSSLPPNITDTNAVVYVWDGFSETEQYRSLQMYIENNSDRIRSKYLDFVSNLGNRKINSKRLSEYFEVDKHYNLWWMSLIAEKSPFKSTHLNECLKLLAIEEIVNSEKPDRIILNGHKTAHKKSIQALSKKFNTNFYWRKIKTKKTNVSPRKLLKSIYQACFHPIQAAVLIIRYIWSRRKLNRLDKPKWFQSENTVFFLSYFIALKDNILKQGQFFSEMWGPLPDLLRSNNITTNWIHHFVQSKQIPSSDKAVDYINQFNSDPMRNGNHNFIENYLTHKVILTVVKKYFIFVLRTLSFSIDIDIFSPKNSNVTFWYFLKNDWLSSLRGSSAVENILWIELFDRVLADLPKQKLGFFLQENQGWEMAFISAWKKHNHGRLLGVAHSTIRYWDLRYYEGYCLSDVLNHKKPQPDYIVVNGREALSNIKIAHKLKHTVLEAEALRYLYLNKLIKNTPDKKYSETKTAKRKILVVGDIQKNLTRSMLSSLNEIAVGFEDCEFTFKPHPGNIMGKRNFKKFKPVFTNQPLGKLFTNVDIVVSSGATSSGLEAYISAIPTIVFLDQSEFNLSACRGKPGVIFVSSSLELTRALGTVVPLPKKDIQDEFFWLDANLPKWKKLLADFGYPQVLD